MLGVNIGTTEYHLLEDFVRVVSTEIQGQGRLRPCTNHQQLLHPSS